MADLEKKIVVPVEADVAPAESKVKKLKKDVVKEAVAVPVDIDLSKIEDTLHGLQTMLGKISSSFDDKFKFSGMQKSLTDAYDLLKKITKEVGKDNNKELAIKVDVRGFNSLYGITKEINENISVLNKTKIDIDSFEKLYAVFEKMEASLHSIVKGMNFDNIRPSTQIQDEIAKTTERLEQLAKAEKKIQKIEKFLRNDTAQGISKQILEFGDSEDGIKETSLQHIIRDMKEYIALGGDLSKIEVKNFYDVEQGAKAFRSLADVFEILQDEGKIDIIDSSSISNDVEEIRTLRAELVELTSELNDAKIRENRDLNVSLDTKSVEDFTSAITEAVKAVGSLNIQIPEGFTLEGLSAENLDKIINKIEEVVSSVKELSQVLANGVDFSKVNESLQGAEAEPISFKIKPNVNTADFLQEVQNELDKNGLAFVDVRVEPIVASAEAFMNSIEDQLLGHVVKININPNAIVQDGEHGSLQNIEQKVRDIVTAVNDKIEAFKREEAQVKESSAEEVEALSKIEEKVSEIASKNNLELTLDSSKIHDEIDSIAKAINESIPDTKEIEIKVKQYKDTDIITDIEGKVIEAYRGVQDAIGGMISDKQNGITFYSSRYDVAESYANRTHDGQSAPGKVYKTNLAMKNPLELDAHGSTWKSIKYLGDESDEASEKIIELDLRIGELRAELEGLYDFSKLGEGISIDEWGMISGELSQNGMRVPFSFESIDEFERSMGKLDLTSMLDPARLQAQQLLKELQDVCAQYYEISDATDNMYGTHTTDEWAKIAQANGYDGVVIKNLYDAVGNTFKGEDSLSTIFAVFNSEQLKNLQVVQDNIAGIADAEDRIDSDNIQELGQALRENVLNGFLQDDEVKVLASNWVRSMSDAIALAVQENAPFDSLKAAANQIFATTNELQEKLINLAAQSPIMIDVDLNTIGFGWDYDEIKAKIEELAAKDIVINIKGLIDETVFGMPLNGANDKAKRERDIKDLDYILQVVKEFPIFFEELKSAYKVGDNLFDSKLFQDDMKRISIDINKLIDALKNTGFIDGNLKPTFSIPDSGAQHSLGVVGEKYVMLGRDYGQPATLENTRIKQAKIDELADIGVNIARIVLLRAQDEAYSSDTRRFFEVQERKPGKNHRDVYEAFSQMTKEQMIDLFRDMKAIFEKELAIELHGDNLLFDEKTGVTTPIDLLTRDEYPWMDVANLDGFVHELSESVEEIFGDYNLRGRLEEAKDIVENETFVRKPKDKDKQGIGLGVNPLMDGFVDTIQSKVDSAPPVKVNIEPKIDDGFIAKTQEGINELFKPKEFIEPLTGEVFFDQESFLREFPDVINYAMLDPSKYREAIDEINSLLVEGIFDFEDGNVIKDKINAILNSIPELKNFLPEMKGDGSFDSEYFDNYQNCLISIRDGAEANNQDMGEYVYDYAKQIQQGFNALRPQDMPKIKVDPQIDETDFARKVTEQLNGASANINVGSDAETTNHLSIADAGETELSTMEMLRQKVVEVVTAIDAKTNAFREEEQVVGISVTEEISRLDALKAQVLEIVASIEHLQTTPVALNIDFLDDRQIDDKLVVALEDLKEKINGLNIDTLSELSSVLKGLSVDDNAAENLKFVTEAISQFKNSLNGISEESKDFLQSIDLITSRKDELKDLAKILESSATKIEKAKKATQKGSEDDSNEGQSKVKIDPAKNQAAIQETADSMAKLKTLGKSDAFADLFSKKTQEVEELNQKLNSSTISLSEYKKSIKAIQSELNANKNVVEFLDVSSVEEARVHMENYAKTISGNRATLKKLQDDGNKVTYAWADQNKMVHTLALTYDEATQAMSQTYNMQKQMERHQKNWKERLKQGWKNVTQYAMSFMGFYEIIAQLRNGINVIRELDTALTEMRKVSDETVSSLKNFQEVSFDIADAVGTTAQQIQNSTADWMRLGESMKEAAKSAEVANILLNVSEFSSIDEATKSLVSMSAAYDELDKIDIVDKLNIVGNNYSIATDGLATAIQKSASALTTAGNDMDEAVALITAGNAVVQDADSVGTGMQTIALRLTGTKVAAEQLKELGEDTDDVITSVSKLRDTIMSATTVASNNFQGFDIFDENGNYKSTYEIMVGLSEIYDEIAETDKQMGNNNLNVLLETIAGKRRANIAASILQNEELLKSVYDSSANDSAGSAQEELDKYLESINGKIAKFQNEVQQLWYNLIDSETIKKVVDTGTQLVHVVNNLVSGLVESGLLDHIVDIASGLVSIFDQLTSGLGKANTALVGLLGFAFAQHKKNKSGGRVKCQPS